MSSAMAWIARGDEIVEAGFANDFRCWKVAPEMIVKEALGDADQGVGHGRLHRRREARHGARSGRLKLFDQLFCVNGRREPALELGFPGGTATYDFSKKVALGRSGRRPERDITVVVALDSDRTLGGLDGLAIGHSGEDFDDGRRCGKNCCECRGPLEYEHARIVLDLQLDLGEVRLGFLDVRLRLVDAGDLLA